MVRGKVHRAVVQGSDSQLKFAMFRQLDSVLYSTSMSLDSKINRRFKFVVFAQQVQFIVRTIHHIIISANYVHCTTKKVGSFSIQWHMGHWWPTRSSLLARQNPYMEGHHSPKPLLYKFTKIKRTRKRNLCLTVGKNLPLFILLSGSSKEE